MADRYKRNTMDTVAEWCRHLRRSVPAVYYALACVCAMTVALMVATVFFRVSRVQGESMAPTLNDGDLILLTCAGYSPQAEDIVAVRRDKATPLIKRVIGTAGDRVFIDGETGEVFLNGALLVETYIAQSTLPVDLPGEVIVPDGQLFVLGDNRAVSHDSRYLDVGFVQVDDVIGKAVFRILPLSEKHGLY